MAEIKKSYYAIIPADVRYDKRLTANAKLLYGEITALCNETGECWATNSYFGDLYCVSITSVSKWISQLVEYGYIKNRLVYKEGTKEILNRYLTLVKGGLEEKLNTPIEEKLKDNNTIINNTMNNISSPISNEMEEIDCKIIDYVETKDSPVEEKVIKKFHSLFCKFRTIPGKKFDHKVLSNQKMGAWKKDLDKLMRVDKRSREDLLEVYKFLEKGKDVFWQNTIFSLAAIRKHYDQIKDKMRMESINAKQATKEKEKQEVFQGDIKRVTK